MSDSKTAASFTEFVREVVTALEIFEVAPETTETLIFDHGPGTYFMVCLTDTNTMVVLGDVTVDS